MNRLALLGLCSLLAVPFAGCGRATAPSSPGLAAMRSTTTANGAIPIGNGGGEEPPPTPAAQINAPPSTRIVDPVPNQFLSHVFSSQPATVRWTATDPDGPGPGVKSFRFIVLQLAFDNTVFLSDPDSLLRRDGPDFTNWNEVDGNADHISLDGLVPYEPYLIYVIAFDRRRAHDAHLDITRNGLQFQIYPPVGPR